MDFANRNDHAILFSFFLSWCHTCKILQPSLITNPYFIMDDVSAGKAPLKMLNMFTNAFNIQY